MRLAIRESDSIADIDCEVCREHGRQFATDPGRGGGCYQEGVKLERPFPITEGDDFFEKIWYCPRSCHIAVADCFDAYAAYKDGHLPGPGGLGAQPAKFVQVVTLCRREIGNLEAEGVREQKREIKRRKAQSKGR